MATGCFPHPCSSLSSHLAQPGLITTTHFLPLPLVLREGRKQLKKDCQKKPLAASVLREPKGEKAIGSLFDLSVNEVYKPFC